MWKTAVKGKTGWVVEWWSGGEVWTVGVVKSETEEESAFWSKDSDRKSGLCETAGI